MNTQKAIEEVITFQTLPSQIDHRQGYRYQADRALIYLEGLSKKSYKNAMRKINKVVAQYYSEEGAAQYDAKF